ncbi:mannose-6-phosphate isomerase isoform X2 [Venturia canescens]|nr:mannose-6-phosphate isomerase isoform X2 [Venturia canescens]
MMELECAIQTYDWGERGSKSVVAKLAKTSNCEFILEENKPYAELWMGTHQNGPSRLKKNKIHLKDHIEQNKHILGLNNVGSYDDLPFLFKILSIGKALSIQTHPDKKRAERLHREQPDIYKDANHKPELAIALGPFEAFCGFRPVNEIKAYVKEAPEIRAVIQSNSSFPTIFQELEFHKDGKEFVKKVFKGLLQQEPEIIKKQLDLLIERLSTLDEPKRQFFHADLLERLNKDFPGDVGCFGIYLFNYVTLKPGDAIFIAPNEPHAYLSGDCIECMACSDNVVRAGLTPKPKDISTLIEMLTYSCEPASSKRFEATREDEFTQVFRPPVPDFAVAKISVTPETNSYHLIPRSTASILLMIEGEAEASSSKLQPGSVFFIPAMEKVTLHFLSHPILMFQAFANTSE